MRIEQVFTQINALLEESDLLGHPFYRAWLAGELTRTDVREYAMEYYHHVAAFPTYLSSLHSRLSDGALRRAVLRNLADEEIDGVAHSELWLDFAEGVGARRESVKAHTPLPEVQELVRTFRSLMESPASALAACYAYESQVPRVAKEKGRSLAARYGGDARTCRYFEFHRLADQHHSQVWKRELGILISADPTLAEEALAGAARAASALWIALDGIEGSRVRRLNPNVSSFL